MRKKLKRVKQTTIFLCNRSLDIFSLRAYIHIHFQCATLSCINFYGCKYYAWKCFPKLLVKERKKGPWKLGEIAENVAIYNKFYTNKYSVTQQGKCAAEMLLNVSSYSFYAFLFSYSFIKKSSKLRKLTLFIHMIFCSSVSRKPIVFHVYMYGSTYMEKICGRKFGWVCNVIFLFNIFLTYCEKGNRVVSFIQLTPNCDNVRFEVTSRSHLQIPNNLTSITVA